MESTDTLLLWPAGAPGAAGETLEDQPAITTYLLQSPKPSAAVVVCPGGGYNRRAPHEGEPIARWLNSIGLSAVVLRYRVSPYHHPYPLLDAQRAIRFVRHRATEWHIDPERIGIIGFSAGGHLASTAGTHFDPGTPEATDPVDSYSCRPDFQILCYPVITTGEFRHVGSIRNILGPEPSDTLCELLSNEKQITSQTPPAFLWHTANDPVVPVENSLQFASALRRNSVPFALHVFPSGRHGLGLASEHAEVKAWTKLCESWLQGMGFAPTEVSES